MPATAADEVSPIDVRYASLKLRANVAAFAATLMFVGDLAEANRRLATKRPRPLLNAR